jgi:dipeptidyl aminopeptidase/acylaminoacyl peptidase
MPAAVAPGAVGVDDDSVFLTVDDVVGMESAGEFDFSANGKRMVWVKTTPDKSKNKRVRHLYLTEIAGNATIQLTRGDDDEHSPRFSPGGDRVAFLSARGKNATQQIYVLDLRGGEAEKITGVATGIRNFEWLNDDTFLFSAREDSTVRERDLKKNKDDVVVVADQRNYPPVRLFRYEIGSKKTSRLTTNNGEITSFALSPDRKRIVTVENQSVDYQYDYRIPPKQFLIDLENDTRKEICTEPHVDPFDFKWSADGAGLYCRRTVSSDTTDTFVGITRLYYYDVETDELERVQTGWTKGLGRSYVVIEDGVVAALADGTVDRIVHIVGRDGDHQTMRLATEKPVRLAAGFRGGKRIVYFTSTASSIPEVMTATVSRGQIENREVVIDLNESLKKKRLVTSEVIRWVGAEGDTVEGVLYYPADYDTAYSYPLVACIHGGPAGVDPDFFTERWSNYPHLLASKGTFVLKVNYHGSGNYGLDWVESIKERYYELEVPDILSGIDHLVNQGNVDDDALAIMGWSNGSILAIACCIESDRFKALCAGAGDVNWTSDFGNCAFGAAFDRAYFGGAPWESTQTYVDKSPLFRIDQLKTPTLIMFGGKDTSVPTEQGWQHFRAMQQIGIAPVRFLLFPGTGHGLRKLSHQKRKIQEELVWFDRFLFESYKPADEAFDESSPLAFALKKAQVKMIGYLVGDEIDASIVPEIVEVAGLRVSRFEVTRAQFSAFDPNYSYPPGTDNHPVNDISLPLAQAYCLWLGEKTGRAFRLPTEAEMKTLLKTAEANLAHENNLEYWLGFTPTPDEMDHVMEKVEELQTARLLIEPVGSFRPVVDRGSAVYDLGGNVAEWVTDEKGQGNIMGLSAVTSRDDRSGYTRPPLVYVGFRIVETQ